MFESIFLFFCLVERKVLIGGSIQMVCGIETSLTWLLSVYALNIAKKTSHVLLVLKIQS